MGKADLGPGLSHYIPYRLSPASPIRPRRQASEHVGVLLHRRISYGLVQARRFHLKPVPAGRSIRMRITDQALDAARAHLRAPDEDALFPRVDLRDVLPAVAGDS